MPKTVQQIKEVFANAKAKAAADSDFTQRLTANFHRALSGPGFSMTHEDWDVAFDHKDALGLMATGPWLSG